MRRRPSLGLLFAAFWSAGPAWAGIPDSDSRVQESKFCGDSYYFFVTEPPGWKPLPEPEGHSYDPAISFGDRPPEGAPGGDDVTLVMRVVPSGRALPDLDPRDALSSVLDLMTLSGGAFEELRELNVAHPSMPSASVRVVGQDGNLYVAAVVVPRGGGSHATLMLSITGREASPSELAAWKAMLASFRYDPDHYCYPDAAGVEQTLPLEREPWHASTRAEALRTASQQSSAALGYSFVRAAQACLLRAQAFVPVDCHSAELDGKAVFLVDFYRPPGQRQDERQGAEEFAGHARQIAIRWCFETRAASAAPQLVFATREPGIYQRFDCKAMRLGASFRGKESAPAAAR